MGKVNQLYNSVNHCVAQSDKRVDASEAYSVYKVRNETHHKSLDPFLDFFILLQIKAFSDREDALIYSSLYIIDDFS